jgi:hypothetical protein
MEYVLYCGSCYTGKRVEKRVMFPLTTWFLGTAFLTWAYSGLVFGFFLDPYEKRLSSIDQLVDSSLDIAVNPDLNLSVIQASNNPWRRKLALKMRVLSRTEIITFDPRPGEAFMDERNILSLRIRNFRRSNNTRLC